MKVNYKFYINTNLLTPKEDENSIPLTVWVCWKSSKYGLNLAVDR